LDFEILKKYQDNFSNLETIILPISYFSLWTKLEAGPESWRMRNYVLYYGIGSCSIEGISEVLKPGHPLNIVRLLTYYKNESPLTISKQGWGATYKSENSWNLEKTGQRAALRHTIHEDMSKIFNENITTLNLIAEWCKKRNIKLIILTTPAYKTYRDNLNKEQLNTMIETATQFAKKHTNCEYINLLDDSSFTAKDFYDADHLNEIGAERLSFKLAHYIDSLNLSKKTVE
jgi:tRNA isopentenyl-2-thiomethyl-A-37 hydroxylase MiaE